MFLAPRLVAPQISFKRLVFVGQYELIRQVVLVEVVNQVPEQLLVLLRVPQLHQIYLKVALLQHLADVLEQTTRTLKLGLKVVVASAPVFAGTGLSVDLLANRNLQLRPFDILATESAEH